jgi:hypothetical protein
MFEVAVNIKVFNVTLWILMRIADVLQVVLS